MPPKAPANKKESETRQVSDTGNNSAASPSSPVPELKEHHSAPSYLQSLAENDLPPFRLPQKEPRPLLLAGPSVLVTEEDIVELIAVSDVDPPNARNAALTELLVKKGIILRYELVERNFLIMFLTEAIDYAAQRDFSAFKLSILFTIYLTTHLYFKWYYWSQPIAIWNYFKELMFRHTVEDTPDGQECFDPVECYDIVTHFHTMYITNLPLIHIVTFGAHRLRLHWPFRVK